jgi:uncharacterized protein
MNLALAEQNKIAEICQDNDVEFCALFGSFARGEGNQESDVDLLIRFAKPKSLLGHISLTHQFEDVLGKEVDLITEKELSPHIKENVMKDLKIIYGK